MTKFLALFSATSYLLFHAVLAGSSNKPTDVLEEIFKIDWNLEIYSDAYQRKIMCFATFNYSDASQSPNSWKKILKCTYCKCAFYKDQKIYTFNPLTEKTNTKSIKEFVYHKFKCVACCLFRLFRFIAQRNANSYIQNFCELAVLSLDKQSLLSIKERYQKLQLILFKIDIHLAAKIFYAIEDHEESIKFVKEMVVPRLFDRRKAFFLSRKIYYPSYIINVNLICIKLPKDFQKKRILLFHNVSKNPSLLALSLIYIVEKYNHANAVTFRSIKNVLAAEKLPNETIHIQKNAAEQHSPQNKEEMELKENSQLIEAPNNLELKKSITIEKIPYKKSIDINKQDKLSLLKDAFVTFLAFPEFLIDSWSKEKKEECIILQLSYLCCSRVYLYGVEKETGNKTKENSSISVLKEISKNSEINVSKCVKKFRDKQYFYKFLDFCTYIEKNILRDFLSPMFALDDWYDLAKKHMSKWWIKVPRQKTWKKIQKLKSEFKRTQFYAEATSSK